VLELGKKFELLHEPLAFDMNAKGLRASNGSRSSPGLSRVIRSRIRETIPVSCLFLQQCRRVSEKGSSEELETDPRVLQHLPLWVRILEELRRKVRESQSEKPRGEGDKETLDQSEEEART